MYNIKSKSCLHILDFFHIVVVDEFAPDLVHDLFEGIAVEIFTNIWPDLVSQA